MYAATSDIQLQARSLVRGDTVDIVCDGDHSADRDDLLIGLSWDFFQGCKRVDLDASAVCFDEMGMLQDACYFNQLEACDGALRHSGDSRDGSGDGFDETISLDFDKLPLNVHIIAVVVNCQDAGANFSDVKTASCLLQDYPVATAPAARVLTEISIGCKGKYTGIVLCVLVRKDGNPRTWTVTCEGELCTTGKNFNECMPTIRKCVDAHLESWVAQERILSLEKTFNMRKGDSAGIPMCVGNVNVGLGWDCSSSVDLDASVLILDRHREVKETCSFSKRNCSKWGVTHQGDNMTGAGSGDDETIKIDLRKAANHGGAGTSLVVTVNVWDVEKTFGKDVTNAYVRLYQPGSSSNDLARYKLSNGSVTTQGLIFAELYCRGVGTPWQLTAAGISCGGRSAQSSETKMAVKELRDETGKWIAPIPIPEGTDGCCSLS